GWFGLVDRLRSQPGLALKAVAQETGQDQTSLQRSLEGLDFLSLEAARSYDPTALTAAIETLGHDWSLYGAFQGPAKPRPVDLATVVALGVVQKLMPPSRNGLPTDTEPVDLPPEVRITPPLEPPPTEMESPTVDPPADAEVEPA